MFRRITMASAQKGLKKAKCDEKDIEEAVAKVRSKMFTLRKAAKE